jgi:uncharacterized membrane protein
MSSSGTFTAPLNNNANYKEGIVTSSEEHYSFVPQSDRFNIKQSNREVFKKNQKASRIARVKQLRVDKPKSDIKEKPHFTNYKKTSHQSGIEYIHKTLSQSLFPASILDQAKIFVKNNSGVEDSVKNLFDVLEVLGALAISLPTCKTPTQVAAQLVLFIRSLTKDSITANLLKQADTRAWCTRLFGLDIFETQSSVPEGASWLNIIPDLNEKWEAVRNAPLFSKISNMIAVAASIGLCSVTNLKWSVAGVDLFRVGTLQKHSTAVDLVGAILDTIVVFIEGGYECFKQRSFAPLFFSSDASRDLDALYFPLIEMHEHAMVFNLHEKPVEIRGVTKCLTDLEYGSLLDEALALADLSHKSARGTWQQGVLEKRMEVLRKNRAAYKAKRISGCMRYAPFTIYIFGPSGVGKSAVSQILMADCLKASGANPDPTKTAILKESDKYDSSLKGDTEGIFFDDMGNTKVDFLDKSPTERMIDINNNMITYANKADLHEKGKIEIRPRVFVITSNVPLMNHGNAGSVCPFSIVRRADLHIEVAAKKDFQLDDGRLDSKKANDYFPGSSLVNDIWDLSLSTPHAASSKGTRPIDRQNPTRKHSILETLRVATTMCKDHFDNQRSLIAKQEKLISSRNYCDTCLLGSDLCSCTSEEQAGVADSFDYIASQFEFMGYFTDYCLGLVPYYFFENCLVKFIYLLINTRGFLACESASRNVLLLSLFIVLGGMYIVDIVCPLFTFVIIFLHIVVYFSLLACWRDERLDSLARRRDISVELFESIRRSKKFQLFAVCLSAKLLYNFIAMFRTVSSVQQNALAPENVEEITARDREVNPWATAVAAKIHICDRNATMTHDQVVKKISQNLFHGTFLENNFAQTCDILAISGNVFLVPLHLFKNRKDMKVRIVKSEGSTINSSFKGFMSVEHMIPIPGKDLAIVSIPSGGIFADILHLFPETISASGSSTFMYRNSSGALRCDSMWINYTKDSESGGPGYTYRCPYDTFTGLCMAVAVANFKSSCIAGVHLRGVSGTPAGKSLIISRGELKEAMNLAHKKWVGAFPSHSSGTFPTLRYDTQVLTSQEIHPKSPINFLPEGSNIEYLGQGGQRVSMTHSSVKQTPISEHVTTITGVENDHGPPSFHRWKMWQESLVYSANPGAGVEPSLIARAYTDYTNGLIDTFLSKPFVKMTRDELKPLDELETLCGRDGARFIDQMQKGTSKGFPLSGPKSELITLLDPLDYPTHSCPAKCDKMILEETEAMRAKLKNGERCYSIFKACVKDEPTKIGKTKVRVFQAADWATQMLVRQYFLPVARLLSIFPVVSECAVGINAQGPEWDQLARHMTKFGTDRIFAGDYSKYDLRMPAALINAAFASLIEIAQTCGQYTSDDIIIMKGIASEIAYSCVAYNGDIIIHRGSNPSGQNMTVYINCIVNSLLMRCAYYHMYPAEMGNPEPFRVNVAVMTYGDDVKGSVRKGHDWYNHISYADFLAKRDMKFTMPDKTSEPIPYMLDEDADFLKRHNRFDEDTGLIHGTLDEASIFKSLHTVLESKVVSLADQSAMNIDGALREWWQYGKVQYEFRRKQMQEVAELSNLTHACKELDVTYEDRLKMFRAKYFDEEEDVPLESKYENQCGIEIPLNVDDHCLGTSANPFYWWEHICADLSLLVYVVLGVLLYYEKVTFKIGKFDKRWIYVFLFTTGGYPSWKWIFYTAFKTMLMPYCLPCYVRIQNAWILFSTSKIQHLFRDRRYDF